MAIARYIGDRNGEGATLGNLGVAYNFLGEYRRAIEFHQQRLAIAREIDEREGEGIALGNLGETLLKLERHSEAQEKLQAALEIFRRISVADIRVSSSKLGLTKRVKNCNHIVIIHTSMFAFLFQTSLQSFFKIQSINC